MADIEEEKYWQRLHRMVITSAALQVVGRNYSEHPTPEILKDPTIENVSRVLTRDTIFLAERVLEELAKKGKEQEKHGE